MIFIYNLLSSIIKNLAKTTSIVFSKISKYFNIYVKTSMLLLFILIIKKPLIVFLINIVISILIRSMFIGVIHAETSPSLLKQIANLMISEPTEAVANEGGAINYGPLTYIAGLLITESDISHEGFNDNPSSYESSMESSDEIEYESHSDTDYPRTERQPRKGFHYAILDQLDLLLQTTRNSEELFIESINYTVHRT